MADDIDLNLAKRKGAATTIDGIITIAAVILAFAAFDDITTDNAASFKAEYACLALCLIWMAVLIVRLVIRSRHIPAVLCTVLVLALLWGQREIGPGTTASWQAEYVTATAAMAGIFLVACWLVVSGIRSLKTQPANMEYA